MSAPARLTRLRIRVRGLVQGVGFQPFVYRLARRHGLTGWVHGDEQGVLCEVQGNTCETFLLALKAERPPTARIDAVEFERVPPSPEERGFSIDAGGQDGAVQVSLGADHGPCRECLEELFDPGARRYLYPFLNCTHCGPRFTITRGPPYDRAQTSMAGFALCADCQREYDDPLDRHFRAQALACPRCGPKLSMPLPEIAQRLREGQLVALKGVGGFLLACDAHNDDSVNTLRQRKESRGEPFACMVSSLASARALAEVHHADAELLTSSQRPVVLVRRQRGDGLSQAVAPELGWLGLMLPSTPLQYALFHQLAGKPEGTRWLERPLDLALVMTSANPGGEPLITDDGAATRRLKAIADTVVTHDREVVVRADDSVMRVVANVRTFLRRARGFVPEPVHLAFDAPPLLAVGGHLKTTVCLTRGREAWVSQHLGDLDDAATSRFLEETLEHLQRALGVTPVAVAHDLHPDLLSTRKALGTGLRAVPVQHQHAHLAAVVAEYGLQGPMVGLALDGDGYGSDGAIWGGELMALDGSSFERLGHLRPLPLSAEDLSERAPWRMAAAALRELGRAQEISARFGARAAEEPAGAEGPVRHSSALGRFFDAACGLLGVRLLSSYEGEAPMVLESLVTAPQVLAGTWRCEGGVLDVLPLLDALIGRPARDGANVFHGSLAAALVEWVLPVLQQRGLRTLVLSGGCVTNKVLTEAVVGQLAARGITALIPRQVPANDGGLSLGQAYVAARVLAG